MVTDGYVLNQSDVDAARQALQEFARALIDVAQQIADAILRFFEGVREIAEQGRAAAEQWLRPFYQCLQVYRTLVWLRSWHMPYSVAVVIAYLWVMKRWPPKTTIMPG